VRKYADDFPTWNEFLQKLDEFVQYYNNKLRNYLQTIEGELMSPIEAYNKVEHKLPTKIEIQTKMRDPYIEMRMVQRSMIEKNGILYWHPIFASMIGKKIGIYYDERNLSQLTICNDKGQIYDEKATAINPGLQSGDDLKSMIENNRRTKIGELCYLSLCDVAGVKRIERMLKIIGTELLPISSLTEKEPDVKYLNFDDALDKIAGEDDINVADIVSMSTMESANLSVTNELSDEYKVLMKSLKDDIAGMF
jgi:hypothetical protein